MKASSIENRILKNIFRCPRIFILLTAVVIATAAVWIIATGLSNFTLRKHPGTGYPIAKHIQYGYTLQNETNRAIDKVELWTHAPVKQTANQRCLNLTANFPYQLLTDNDGNQVLHFTFEKLAPYASRIITVKAHLLVSRSANPIAAEPAAIDLKPEQHIESNHPIIRRAAAILRQTDAMKTVDAVFRWVAGHVRYSGYAAQAQGALSAIANKKGDCTEYTDLFVALCRANNIPARRIGGYFCPQNTVLKARDYHNWGEFYDNGIWQLADPQNNVLMQNQDDYIAMRIMRAAGSSALGPYNRFRIKGEGVKVIMN